MQVQEHLLQDLLVKSRHLTYFRLAFASIILLFSLIVQRFGAQELDIIGLIAAGFAVSIFNLVGLILFSDVRNLSRAGANWLNALLLAVDIAALSYVVHATNGAESDLFFLYLLPILLASNVFNRLGIFVTALAASAGYLLTVVAENASFLPYLNSAADAPGLTAAYAQRLWVQIGSRSATLFLVSIVWAAFCHRMSGIAQESNFRLGEQLEANTTLLEELKTKTERQHLSDSISLALRRTLDLETILSTTCTKLSEALNSAHCLIVTRAGSRDGQPVIWDSLVIASPEKNDGKSIITDDLKQYFVDHDWHRKPETVPFNKIILSDTPFEDGDLLPISSALKAIAVTGILVRPIMYGTELKGVLSILSSENAGKWQPSELELIDSVAGQVAVAIEHAELVAKLSETNTDLLLKNENLDAKNLELRQIQSQLIHQEKMASLGRIVAGIAHELNNPINFVHGNLPYLRDYIEELKNLIACFDALPQEYQQLATEAKQKINYEFVVTDLDNIVADLFEGTERIRQIIRNLRSFSRLDEAELKEASIEESIESTLKILGQYYGKDKTPVELNFAGLPAILCYPGKLNQVWMNLLANAAQAVAGKEDGKVIISTRREGETFLVSIEDNGAGIKTADQSKIFEPFFTTKPVGQGTGLGLSISHSIVERHGGRIWFETSPGKGTSFLVRLPLKAPRVEQQEAAELAITDRNPPAEEMRSV